MDRNSEIRKLLTGQYRMQDGIIIALGEMKLKNFLNWQGLPSGADNAGLFGVSSHAEEFECDSSISDPLSAFMSVLIRYGKLTALASEPDAVGFLDRRTIQDTMLYLLEETSTGFRLTIYTGRSPLAKTNITRAFGHVVKELPEAFHIVETINVDNPQKKKGLKEKVRSIGGRM